MLYILPELYATGMFCTARRDSWEEGTFVYGKNARQVSNEDIASTLVNDECLKYYLEGDDLVTEKELRMVTLNDEGVKVDRPWQPTHEDLHSNDWAIIDHTDVVKLKKKSEVN